MAKKAPESMPEQSPFVQSPEEASLRRIAEAGRTRRQARDVLHSARLAHKEAKTAYEKACEAEQQIADAETVELPLFPQSRDSGGETASADATPPPAPRDSSVTFLSSIDGFPSSAVIALGSVGLQSLADLESFLGKGHSLELIEGIDPHLAHRVRAALNRHGEGKGAA